MVIMEAVVCGAFVLNCIMLKGVSSLNKLRLLDVHKLEHLSEIVSTKNVLGFENFLDFEGRICCRAFV